MKKTTYSNIVYVHVLKVREVIYNDDDDDDEEETRSIDREQKFDGNHRY